MGPFRQGSSRRAEESPEENCGRTPARPWPCSPSNPPAMRRKRRFTTPRECEASLPPSWVGVRCHFRLTALRLARWRRPLMTQSPAGVQSVREVLQGYGGVARPAPCALRWRVPHFPARSAPLLSSVAPRPYARRPPFFSRLLLRLSHGILQTRHDPGDPEARGEDHAGHAVLAGIQGGKGPGARAAPVAFRRRGAAAGSACPACWPGRARGAGELGAAVCGWGGLYHGLGLRESWLS